MSVVQIEPYHITIQSFFVDTKRTLSDRIAWALGTIPRFLYIEWSEEGGGEGGRVVYVQKLADEIMRTMKPLEVFLEENSDIYEPSDILWLWYLNKSVFDIARARVDPVFDAKYVNTLYEIDSKREYQVDIEQQYLAFSIEQKSIMDRMALVSSIPKQPTLFVQSGTHEIHWEFDCEYESLLSIFDRLHVSSTFPLITHRNYYKVLHGYVPPLDWLSSDSAILVKLDEHREIRILSSSSTLTSPSSYSYKLIADSNVSSTDIRVLLENIDINQGKSDAVFIGSSIVLDQRVSTHVFADILLTKPFLTEFVSVNDNSHHVNQYGHQDVYFQWGRNEYLRLSMTSHIAKTAEFYPINTPYTQFKIMRSTSKEMLVMVQELLARILYLYTTEKLTIDAYYDMYIPPTSARIHQEQSSPEEEKDEEKEEANMPQKVLFPKDVYPELFQSKAIKEIYTRRCQSDRQPEVISEEEAKNESSSDVMQFPKPADAHVSEPKYFICRNSKYPHVGLIEFQNEIGVAPCCFKLNQRNKPIYKQYFSGQEVEVRRQRKEHINTNYQIRTNKVLLNGNTGFFPDSDKIINDVGAFFRKINTLPNKYSVMRIGVAQGPDSIIDCMNLATGLDLNRLALSTVSIGVARQEMYDMDLNSMREYLLPTFDSPSYLDPLRVIRLLELVYNCNVLVFTKEKTTPGKLAIPYHTHGYCAYVRDEGRPSVFIYCHEGGEMDRLDCPQCELIVPVIDGEAKTVWEHDITNPIYRYAWRQYDQQIDMYFGKFKNTSVPMSTLLDEFAIVGQAFDAYGKVRYLVLDGDIYIETSPIAPLPVDIVDQVDFKLLELDINFVTQFIQAHKLSSVSHHTLEGRTRYVTALFYGCIQFTFYVDDYLSRTSLCRNFEEQSRIARYATNWIQWLFSKYCYVNNLSVGGDARILSTFVDRYTQINLSVRYNLDQVNELFAKDQSGLVQRRREDNIVLVCSSEEMLRRLSFQLELMIERRPEYIATFHERRTMDRFYTNVADFTRYANETLFEYHPGVDGFSLLSRIRPPHHTLHLYPPDTQRPFFFRNRTITNGQVTLCQNVSTLHEAYNKLTLWETQHYNGDQQIVYGKHPYYLLALQRQTGQVAAYLVDARSKRDVPEIDRRVMYTDVGLTPIMFL